MTNILLRKPTRASSTSIILLALGISHLSNVDGWIFSSTNGAFRTLKGAVASTESAFVKEFEENFPSFYYGSALDADEDKYEDPAFPALSPVIDHRFRVPKRAPLSLPHLFRHYDDISFDSWLRCANPEDFWTSVGYDVSQLPNDLTEAGVHEVIAPHVRFLVQVLQGGSGKLAWVSEAPTFKFEDEEECEVDEGDHHSMTVSPETQSIIPHSFFRVSMERTIAPWHAYLQHHGLPCGPDLLKDTEKITDFCKACESGKPAHFAELCQRWAGEESSSVTHSLPRIQAFLRGFRRGLSPAVRNALCEDLDAFDCTPTQMVGLLVSHGANFLQKDKQGVDLLHWAAGTHHWEAVQILLKALTEERYPNEHYTDELGFGADILLESTDSKDGATPLHWAACGFGRQIIGTGGSLEVCAGLLQHAGDRASELARATTWYGATPLMWAAWAGSLEVVLLLLNAEADPRSVDNRKQSAAHWAAAAGHVSVCQCLHGILGDDFFAADADGKTALDYAEEFHREELVNWLRSVRDEDSKPNGELAA